jgi:hypothetical protein
MTRDAPLHHYVDVAGTAHEVSVRRTSDGHWEIVDADARQLRVIDTLVGFDDGRPQAEALARDYVATIGRGVPTTGPPPALPGSEEGGADAHGRPGHGGAVRRPQARRVALPRTAG